MDLFEWVERKGRWEVVPTSNQSALLQLEKKQFAGITGCFKPSCVYDAVKTLLSLQYNNIVTFLVLNTNSTADEKEKTESVRSHLLNDGHADSVEAAL